MKVGFIHFYNSHFHLGANENNIFNAILSLGQKKIKSFLML